MTMWQILIGSVALLFSIVSFVLFVLDATHKKPDAGAVANRVMAAAPDLDLTVVGGLAKALADAFSKVGPGLAALLGAILFLLLSGEATLVYHLTGGGGAPQVPANHAPANPAPGSAATPANPAASAGGNVTATGNRH
jgi:hypothetical protein